MWNRSTVESCVSELSSQRDGLACIGVLPCFTALSLLSSSLNWMCIFLRLLSQVCLIIIKTLHSSLSLGSGLAVVLTLFRFQVSFLAHVSCFWFRCFTRVEWRVCACPLVNWFIFCCCSICFDYAVWSDSVADKFFAWLRFVSRQIAVWLLMTSNHRLRGPNLKVLARHPHVQSTHCFIHRHRCRSDCDCCLGCRDRSCVSRVRGGARVWSQVTGDRRGFIWPELESAITTFLWLLVRTTCRPLFWEFIEPLKQAFHLRLVFFDVFASMIFIVMQMFEFEWMFLRCPGFLLGSRFVHWWKLPVLRLQAGARVGVNIS